jgi:hypothetical protein
VRLPTALNVIIGEQLGHFGDGVDGGCSDSLDTAAFVDHRGQRQYRGDE